MLDIDKAEYKRIAELEQQLTETQDACRWHQNERLKAEQQLAAKDARLTRHERNEKTVSEYVSFMREEGGEAAIWANRLGAALTQAGEDGGHA